MMETSAVKRLMYYAVSSTLVACHRQKHSKNCYTALMRLSVIEKKLNSILASGLTLIVLMLGASSMHLAFDKIEFPQVILGSQFRFTGG